MKFLFVFLLLILSMQLSFASSSNISCVDSLKKILSGPKQDSNDSVAFIDSVLKRVQSKTSTDFDDTITASTIKMLLFKELFTTHLVDDALFSFFKKNGILSVDALRVFLKKLEGQSDESIDLLVDAIIFGLFKDLPILEMISDDQIRLLSKTSALSFEDLTSMLTKWQIASKKNDFEYLRYLLKTMLLKPDSDLFLKAQENFSAFSRFKSIFKSENIFTIKLLSNDVLNDSLKLKQIIDIDFKALTALDDGQLSFFESRFLTYLTPRQLDDVIIAFEKKELISNEHFLKRLKSRKKFLAEFQANLKQIEEISSQLQEYIPKINQLSELMIPSNDFLELKKELGTIILKEHQFYYALKQITQRLKAYSNLSSIQWRELFLEMVDVLPNKIWDQNAEIRHFVDMLMDDMSWRYIKSDDFIIVKNAIIKRGLNDSYIVDGFNESIHYKGNVEFLNSYFQLSARLESAKNIYKAKSLMFRN